MDTKRGLFIHDKAKLDGEYSQKLAKGGFGAFLFDIKCFLGTVLSVAKSDGVVEGGTGDEEVRKYMEYEAAYFT